MSDERSKPRPLLDRTGERFGGLYVRERYGLVMVLILGGYVLAGINDNRLIYAVNSFLWIFLLLTALWSSGLPPRLRQIGLTATALTLVASLSLGFLSADVALGWRSLLLAIAQLAALLAILNRVLRHERVTFQTVMGGVAAYALIGFAMAFAYQGIDLLTEAPFLDGLVDRGDYTYFSFVTLTTLGYGDITAATDLAKRLVVVESFVGQVFIVTLVARMVSLWGQPIRADR